MSKKLFVQQSFGVATKIESRVPGAALSGSWHAHLSALHVYAKVRDLPMFSLVVNPKFTLFPSSMNRGISFVDAKRSRYREIHVT